MDVLGESGVLTRKGNVMATSDNSSGGIGFLGLLAIVFITLKLCRVIEWSWWWVLAPLWVPAAAGFAILSVVLLAYLVCSGLDTLKKS